MFQLFPTDCTELGLNWLVTAALSWEAAEPLKAVSLRREPICTLGSSRSKTLDTWRILIQQTELKCGNRTIISVVQTLASLILKVDVRRTQHTKPGKPFYLTPGQTPNYESIEPNTFLDKGLSIIELLSDDISMVINQKAGLSDAGGSEKTKTKKKQNAPNRHRSPHWEAMKKRFTVSSGHSRTPTRSSEPCGGWMLC